MSVITPFSCSLPYDIIYLRINFKEAGHLWLVFLLCIHISVDPAYLHGYKNVRVSTEMYIDQYLSPLKFVKDDAENEKIVIALTDLFYELNDKIDELDRKIDLLEHPEHGYNDRD